MLRTLPLNNRGSWARAGAAVILATGLAVNHASADEGGLSFWLPGTFGSLSAAPSVPGFSFGTIYIHPSASAGADKAFRRGGRIDLGVDGRGNLVAFGPTYTFEQQVLGGQFSLSALAIYGRNNASVDAQLTGPNGGVINGHVSDSISGFGDLLPQATLKWNFGVHNLMTYATGDVPIGRYDPDRLANMGLGHGAVDGGAGYTYFDPSAGHEFSAVFGLTYNFENPDTDYKNGIDAHFDWAASQFLNEHVQVGVVGYWFQQLTGDSGAGATLGDFKSRVAGIGPQIGFLFPVSDKVGGYLNIKGFKEFAAENRPEGWNAWVTLAFSPAAPKKAPETPPLFGK
ncbi:MAG: transporter [Microvirga sp.]